MTFSVLSDKQRQVLRWCHKNGTKDKYDAIICDGAVRSGKTVVMVTSFIHWAMRYFDGCSFAICGKTVRSAERNIIVPMQQIADITKYYSLSYLRSNSLLTVRGNSHTNYFYIFGGRDESSYMLIQGITLAGVLFDEVALMPRSFVEQALARCSNENSKFWFNCNPDNPEHWFYKEWILKADEKRALHLHFNMRDNPSLSEKTLDRYENMYEGVFLERYVLGRWVAAEGLVYRVFNKSRHVVGDDYVKSLLGDYYISIDYGTANPFSMGLWLLCDGVAVRVDEYYFDSRKQGYQKTDEEYYAELERLAKGKSIRNVIVDPSAASFITCIMRHARFSVIPANNDVIDGIRYTGTLLGLDKIKVHERCCGCIREFSMYSWDSKAAGDKVKKEFDHAMDEVRYFCNTVLRFKNEFQPQSDMPRTRRRRAIVSGDDMRGGWDGFR